MKRELTINEINIIREVLEAVEKLQDFEVNNFKLCATDLSFVFQRATKVEVELP